jgi:RimJ/RimL family protein N-acetyltransferase
MTTKETNNDMRQAKIFFAQPEFSGLMLGHTQLRLVEPYDADYIYNLRVNSDLNTYLSTPPASAQAQREWIIGYKTREAVNQEFYFVICTLLGKPCGAVRLYDFSDRSFCWGSWILDGQKSRYSAIESALLVYEAGFGRMGFQQSHFDVRRENVKVISFHKKMGARETRQDDQNVYFEISPADVAARREALMHIIGVEKK